MRGCPSILALAFASSLSLSAAAAPPSQEIGYFTDADQLSTDTPSVARVNPGLPPGKLQFCSRTNQQISAPFVENAVRKARVEENSKQAKKLFNELNLEESHAKDPQRVQFDELSTQIAVDTQWLESPDAAKAHALAFINPPGAFNTGLCWFHSRFQRSMLYLARFMPELPRPSESRAKELIAALIAMDHVVEIPGFSTIEEFSSVYKDQIITAMDFWSVRVLPALAVRLGDRRSIDDPSEARTRLETLFRAVTLNGDIQYVRFHMLRDALGFASHSFLVFDAVPILGEATVPGFPPKIVGYSFLILDSFKHQIFDWLPVLFDEADSRVTRGYLDYDDDLVSINEALAEYCR